MEGGPEIEAGHRHHTGHWIDYVLGGTAILISLISLWLGTKNAEHMERLVAANSYPDLSFYTTNDGDGSTVALSISNHGVGPARIKTIELFYEDRPLGRLIDFISAALADDPPAIAALEQMQRTSPALGELLPPRETITLAHIPHVDGMPEAWTKIDKARFKLHASICYCSLFNECFVRDSRKIEPETVKACKAGQPVIYHETEPESYWKPDAGNHS